MLKPPFPVNTIDKFRHPLLCLALGSLLFTGGCDSSDSVMDPIESDMAVESGVALESDEIVESDADADFEISDWTDATHSKSAELNYDEVFDDTQVKRLDFVVSATEWQSMLDDMTASYGEFGTSNTAGSIPGDAPGGLPGGVPGGIPGDGVAPPIDDQPVQGAPPVFDDQFAPDDAVPNEEPIAQAIGPASSEEDPIFVPADVYYNGIQWYSVGIRFKGNSTLQGAWGSGVLKLSFKMDFDEFEDDYPQIKNQRFYGFKKFSLKNNYDDNSQIREKVAADIFRSAGLAASRTAFYTLYLDHGNGPEYFGLYTLVEEVDGTVLDTQFVSDEGNLYKPENDGSTFAENSFSEDDFEKKTNEDDEDWSDILALFDALHDDTASTDAATWRANMEAVFDVEGFLSYLAVNGIIQNWDTYGRMPHNYYLYNNPENGLLTWIPWDNNESLQAGKQGGSLDLGFTTLSTEEWPLIGYIYADDVYRARYNELLSEVMAGPFETSSIQATYDNYAGLVEPYATSEVEGYSFLRNSSDFSTGIDVLKAHAATRAADVATYLSTQ